MRSECSYNIYYDNKDLWDYHDDIMKLIEKFNANRRRVKNKIEKEKQEDPSKEIFSVDKELEGCKIKTEQPKKETNNVCKYHSKGFL